MRHPFIGECYEHSRILILGESNPDIGGMTTKDYVKHWLKHPDYMKLSVPRGSKERPTCDTCQKLGRARHAGEKDYPRDPLLNGLTDMMHRHKLKRLDAPRPDDDDPRRREYWSRVAFENFVVRELKDASAPSRPTDADWHEGQRALPALLARLEPRPVVVLVLLNPGGQMKRFAVPTLKSEGVAVVELNHLTMPPGFPKLEDRERAWSSVEALAADRK